MKVTRITTYVEIQAIRGRHGRQVPRLTLDRGEPDSVDTRRRCSPGYVTLALEGDDQGVFMVSQIRRALDEYEREEAA